MATDLPSEPGDEDMTRSATNAVAAAATPRWLPGLAVAGLAVALAACAAPEARDAAVVEAIETGGERYAAEMEARRARHLETTVARFERIHRGEAGDDTYDALLFSGGAEWGAFGAGFMAQWAELGDAAPTPIPEFDFIGGISTGALMAAFVASGEPERYAALEDFYRNVSPSWIEQRGILEILSPRTTSLVDNAGIRAQVESAVDASLIADLRQAHAEARKIMIGTVNLDYGGRRYWDIAEVAATAADPKPRIVDILMAATAIAGVFPPVEIDGALYGDLGYVEGIPAFRSHDTDAFGAAWRERNGDVEPPTARLWLVYNIPIGVEPDPVALSLVPLAMRGYDALVQASFTNPVNTALLLQRLSEQSRTPLVEVRWIAIPRSFEKDPEAPLFSPATTNPLADLGRGAALAPDGGWRRDQPN
jgi:predicted acylesterase/phospholipase RssA